MYSSFEKRQSWLTSLRRWLLIKGWDVSSRQAHPGDETLSLEDFVMNLLPTSIAWAT